MRAYFKEMFRSLGYEPEKIWVKETFTKPYRTAVNNENVLRIRPGKSYRKVFKLSRCPFND